MNLWDELKRRNVFRVALFYIVAAWVVIQVAETLLPVFDVPDTAIRIIVLILALGFPLAVVFSWVFEMTPEGLKRDKDVRVDPETMQQTAHKLNWATLIVAALAIGLLIADRMMPQPKTSVPSAETVGTDTGEAAAETDNPEQASIAVLPFVNMSTDAGNAYFADGISEEILNLLAGVQALSVASRTSAFAFKDSKLSVPEIAEQLGVRYVLEGSVRKAGDQVRITAQLIDADRDRHLWSENYDRTLDDIFAIQDEIAGAIGAALQVELLGDTGQEVQAEQIDPDVYARFLEARHKLRQRTGEAMREANEMLIGIVEAEPDFARAHVVLGEAYLLNRSQARAMPLVPDSVAISQARLHAAKARELNPRLSGIDLILGSIAENVENSPVGALAHYAGAMTLEPNEPRPYHWRGWLLCRAGLLDRSFADLAQALKLDPENPNVRFAIADCLLSGDNPEPALTLARQGVALGNPGGTRLIAIAELALGNRQAAIETVEAMVASATSTAETEFLQDVIRRLGPAPSAEREWSGAKQWEYDYFDLGLVLAMNRYDDILEAIAKRTTSLPGIPGLWSRRHAAMRRDPRFIPLMERFGVVDLWHEIGPPPDCRAEVDAFTCGHGQEPVAFDLSEFNP